jgi:hypothetical protein
VLAGMGIDALAAAWQASAWSTRRVVAGGLACLAAMAWLVWLPPRWDQAPGRTDAERRDAQIARGLELRAQGAPAAHITPCAFEHFALLAAWGRPEAATVEPSTHAPPTGDCPRVVVEP